MTPDAFERQLADLRPQPLSPAARTRLLQTLAALPQEAPPVPAAPPSRNAWRAWAWSPGLGVAAILLVGLALAVGAGTQQRSAPTSGFDATGDLASRHATACEVLVYDGLQRPRRAPLRLWQRDDS
jgi:hypothetical protein